MCDWKINADNSYAFRIGSYRSSGSTSTQKFWIYNPKIGTTRADVEYGGTPPVDSANPTIAIDCPTGAPTYSTNIINFSGTATDDVAISKVEYKIDGGAWQILSGSVSPSWIISNLNIGAAGAHTITFRATDTSNKTAETSITVTYDSTATGPAPIYVGDFETGNFSQWTTGCNQAIENTIVRSGLHSAKFKVEPDTTCWSSERAEVYARKDKTTIEEHDGDEYFYADSIFIPNDWNSSSGWKTVWQVAHQAYGTSPSVGLFAGINDYTLVVKSGDTVAFPYSSISYEYQKEEPIGLDFQKGKWSDFVFHIKWKTDHTGFIEIYHKLQSEAWSAHNTPIYTLVNIPTMQNLNSGISNGANNIDTNIPKIFERHIGLYRDPAISVTQTIYHDEFRIGTTFGSVTGTSTPPTCTAPVPGPGPAPAPCTPTLTCASYPNQCGASLSNGCTNILDCSGACTAPASECNVSTWTCRVPATAPTIAPTLTTAPLTKAVELRWTPVSGQGYKVYRDGILLTTITTTYYRDVPGDLIEHEYQVLAYNSIGNGPMSGVSAMAASSVPVTNMKKLIPIDNFKELIANIFKYSLSIAGGIGLLVIIIGGIMYMGSTGNEQRIITGKKAIAYAIAGLILILLAYSISLIMERIMG